jgi:hypothetical protein
MGAYTWGGVACPTDFPRSRQFKRGPGQAQTSQRNPPWEPSAAIRLHQLGTVENPGQTGGQKETLGGSHICLRSCHPNTPGNCILTRHSMPPSRGADPFSSSAGDGQGKEVVVLHQRARSVVSAPHWNVAANRCFKRVDAPHLARAFASQCVGRKARFCDGLGHRRLPACCQRAASVNIACNYGILRGSHRLRTPWQRVRSPPPFLLHSPKVSIRLPT